MRKYIFLVFSTLSLSFSHFAIAEDIEDINQLVVFGTSALDVSPPIPTINPGGKLWYIQLADLLDAPEPAPAALGGTDFTQTNMLSSSMLASVQSYVASHPNINDKQLFIINNGREDIANFVGTMGVPIPPSIPITAATNDTLALEVLHIAGAENLMIPNLFNLGLVPGLAFNPPQVPPAVIQAVLQYNAALLSQVSALHFDVILLDFYGIVNDIVANPAAFGFTNVTQAAVMVDGDPNTFLFWDFVNFTGAANTVLADYAYSVMQGPCLHAALAETPVGMLKEQNVNILQQLSPLRPECACRCGPSFFIAGDYAPLVQWNSREVEFRNRARDWGLTAGLLYDFDCNTVGAAYGYNRGKGHWHRAAGDYHVQSNTLSLFASHNESCWYVNAIANYAWLDFSSHRDFFLGRRLVEARGHTHGNQWGGALNGAYYVWGNDCWKTGPILNLEYQIVKVNSYRERGALSANLRYHDHHRQSIITAIGWQATMERCTCLGQTVGNIYAAYDREWDNHFRKVRFNVATLEGSHGAIAIGSHRGNFATFGAGLSNTFTSQAELALSYNGWVGQSHLNNHVITLGVNCPFSCFDW